MKHQAPMGASGYVGAKEPYVLPPYPILPADAGQDVALSLNVTGDAALHSCMDKAEL